MFDHFASCSFLEDGGLFNCVTTPSNTEFVAQFQITDFSWFGSVWSRFYQLFDLGVFCCAPLIRNLKSERSPSGFCQTDNPRFSFTMSCYTYRQRWANPERIMMMMM